MTRFHPVKINERGHVVPDEFVRKDISLHNINAYTGTVKLRLRGAAAKLRRKLKADYREARREDGPSFKQWLRAS